MTQHSLPRRLLGLFLVLVFVWRLYAFVYAGVPS